MWLGGTLNRWWETWVEGGEGSILHSLAVSLYLGEACVCAVLFWAASVCSNCVLVVCGCAMREGYHVGGRSVMGHVYGLVGE